MLLIELLNDLALCIIDLLQLPLDRLFVVIRCPSPDVVLVIEESFTLLDLHHVAPFVPHLWVDIHHWPLRTLLDEPLALVLLQLHLLLPLYLVFDFLDFSRLEEDVELGFAFDDVFFRDGVDPRLVVEPL